MATARMSSAPSVRALNYKELFQSLPGAYIVFGVDDPNFTILEENEAHARVAMVQTEDIIGKPLLEVFPDTSEEYKKAGRSRLIESVRSVIKSGKPDVMPELHYNIKDTHGAYVEKFWNVTHFPLLDEDRNVVAVYQATEDITERVHTEQRLRLTEYQLGQALSNGGIGAWVWDIKAEKVMGDASMASMFGISVEEAAKGAPLDRYITAIHPEDRERVRRDFNLALENKTIFECEYRSIDANEDVHWLIGRGHVEVDKSGAPVSFPGIVVDITKRKSAENNLRFLTKASTLFSASLDYHQTLNTIANMVIPDIADWCTIELLDEDGTLQQVAVAHKDPEKVKWAKELRAKQGPPDINAPTGASKVIRTGKPEFYPYITDELLAAGARDKKELELMRSLGFSSVIIAPMKLGTRMMGVISLLTTESRVHYVETDVELAQGLANRAALAVYNAELFRSARHEIQERKKLQKLLAAANASLEKRVVTRTKQLESTNRGLEEEIDKRQQAEAVLKEYSKSLTRSNQELQDFAYVASHDLQEPLRKIQAFGDLLENEYGEELGEGREYLVRMRGAASRMSVLIQDLLAFSRVSTKAQESVPVNLTTVVNDVISDLETRIESSKGSVEAEPLPVVWADPTHMRQIMQNLIGNALKFHQPDVPPIIKVFASSAPVDGMYTISVADNGIGFDEKYLDRIFSVFQRLHGRDTYEGTGIGLAVCRKIVERYGGTITASSKKGAGSTFTFTIPASKKEIRSDNSQ